MWNRTTARESGWMIFTVNPMPSQSVSRLLKVCWCTYITVSRVLMHIWFQTVTSVCALLLSDSEVHGDCWRCCSLRGAQCINDHTAEADVAVIAWATVAMSRKQWRSPLGNRSDKSVVSLWSSDWPMESVSESEFEITLACCELFLKLTYWAMCCTSYWCKAINFIIMWKGLRIFL